MNILLIIGTTREGRNTVRASDLLTNKFEEIASVETTVADLKELEIPHLTKRRFKTDNPPGDVEKLGKHIEDTECIVLVSPEYNHSFPGPLKNALDYFYPEYDEKCFSYVTTSAGGFGGVRQVSHLHDFTLAVGGIPGPHLAVSNIQEKIDAEGVAKEEGFNQRAEEYCQKVTNFMKKQR